ncbi:MAG: hypothetical protein WCF17_16620 [Terracidiphilus sp.]
MRTRQLTKHFCDSALWLFVAGATTLLGGQAKPEVIPGALSGRVFRITVGGDVKPARMADIVLLYAYGNHGRLAEDGGEKSVAVEWLREQRKVPTPVLTGDESQDCPILLHSYDVGLVKTIDWVRANKAEEQFITDKADEDGKFSISVPNPGKYEVLAFGHAGFNDAVWESKEPITINPGEETTIKLTSPKRTCVATK